MKPLFTKLRQLLKSQLRQTKDPSNWSLIMTKSSLLNKIALTAIVATITFESSAQINADYSAVPPSSTQSDPPLVLLSMSRDHQITLI